MSVEILSGLLLAVGYDITKHVGKDLINNLKSCLEGNSNNQQIKNTANILKHYLDTRLKEKGGYNRFQAQINDDWFAYWHEKSKITTDKYMQQVWAKILNGEVDSEGSVSKRTLDFISKSNKSDLESFEKICQFVWEISKMKDEPNRQPFILDGDIKNSIYVNNGINYTCIDYLKEIEVIKLSDPIGGVYPSFQLTNSNPNGHITLSYHDKDMTILKPKQRSSDGTFQIRVGIAKFTHVGAELSKLCDTEPVEGFFEYVKSQFSENFILTTGSKKSI